MNDKEGKKDKEEENVEEEEKMSELNRRNIEQLLFEDFITSCNKVGTSLFIVSLQHGCGSGSCFSKDRICIQIYSEYPNPYQKPPKICTDLD